MIAYCRQVIHSTLKAALFTCLLITSANAAQELVRGNGSDPATLDPTLGEGTPGSNITRDLFEGLMTVDVEGNVIPGQAESYTISDDKKTYVFKIRKNAKWSNGDDVTANDFEYAFKRGIDPVTAARYSWYFKILGIKNGADIIRVHDVKENYRMLTVIYRIIQRNYVNEIIV